MRLTKAKKLSVLKKMLALISDVEWDFTKLGLCWAWERVDFYTWIDLNLSLTDFGLRKPRKSKAYWWPRNRKGLASRKRALRSAIKKLQEGERKLMKQ